MVRHHRLRQRPGRLEMRGQGSAWTSSGVRPSVLVAPWMSDAHEAAGSALRSRSQRRRRQEPTCERPPARGQPPINLKTWVLGLHRAGNSIQAEKRPEQRRPRDLGSQAATRELMAIYRISLNVLGSVAMSDSLSLVRGRERWRVSYCRRQAVDEREAAGHSTANTLQVET